MDAQENGPANMLLSLLPASDWFGLSPKLTPICLEAGQVIHQAGSRIETVHFVESGMLSLVVPLSDGTQTEVGVIGNEGMSALPLLAGIRTAFLKCVVQLPGKALRINTHDFCEEYARNRAFRIVLLRYNEVFRSQLSQVAACNNRHSINHRLVRWLMMADARTESRKMLLSQKFLAEMLGCSQPAAAVSLTTLSRAGLINVEGDEIMVLDRERLEMTGCECYGTIRARMDAIFRGPL